MRSFKKSLLLGPIFLSMILGCQKNPPPNPDFSGEPITMKTYTVPRGQSEVLAGTISKLLSRGDKAAPLGGARVSFNNQLLVAAPDSFQDGMKELISNLEKNPPAPPPAIRAHFWLVFGKKADKPSSLKINDSLTEALSAIQTVDGPEEFKLYDQMATTVTSGEEAKMKNRLNEIEFKVNSFDDKLLLFIRINTGFTEFRTGVNIPVEKTIVLGQSNYLLRGERDPEEIVKWMDKAHYANIYYIVKMEILK